MAQKYYAVKAGYIPGIYKSWDDCKKQTDGFSGAIYKSFKTKEEAEAFLGSSTNIPQKKKRRTVLRRQLHMLMEVMMILKKPLHTALYFFTMV